MKNWWIVACVSVLSGMTGGATVWLLSSREQPQPTSQDRVEMYRTNMPLHGKVSAIDQNFVEASQASTASVVFIQTTSALEYRSGGFLDWFFEPRSSARTSSGSGVIFTQDGYIMTNNHVIDDADQIRVITGKRSYDAKLIGTDPSTDLAVIKIEAEALPTIEVGDSDDVAVGEWVLAVGNPFNLTSTVTAGIVSAKGRNLNILRDKFPIESFIQTDAAINPGNSGGALVDVQGRLVGINTAILSKTGSYAGYGFAVPVNIVKKVFKDIRQYGEVQKAYLGADYLDVDTEISDRLDLEDLNGVVIAEVQKDAAAAKAGLVPGDVIHKINGLLVADRATIEEVLGNKYPGDKVSLEIVRKGKTIQKTLTLTNREGGTDLLKKEVFVSQELEATFETVSKMEQNYYGIKSGVRVLEVQRDGFFDRLEIPEGFIITQIENVAIEEPKELGEILTRVRGRVRIYGIDKNGRKVYYPFYF